jgi:hypothetical protein
MTSGREIMISSLQRIVFAICILFLLAHCTLAQSGQVTQIKIVSSWGGLGPPTLNELTITRKGDSYHYSGKKVDPRLVDRLVKALNEPQIHEPDLANIGITQAWLNANAEKGIKEYAEFYYSISATNLQALYLSTFKNVDCMKRLLPSLYSGWWTDDYPRVEVEVTEDGGSKVIATSEAQQLFMLPWEVTSGGQKVMTFNADIARAVTALLPKKFANRERISGEGLSRVLAEAVMHRIKDKWDALDAENKAGRYLKLLRDTYSVEWVELNGYHNVDYGKEWVNGNSQQDNLRAKVTRKDVPRNFSFGIALPFKDGKVENVDTFIASIDAYRNLILSVPWLREFITTHAQLDYELRFVGDRSFSEKAMQSFTADMKLKGKEALINELAKIQKSVSLLIVGSRTWLIVLPDKTVVFWRFNGFDPTHLWKDESSAWDCTYQGKCVGAVISPDGALVK